MVARPVVGLGMIEAIWTDSFGRWHFERILACDRQYGSQNGSQDVC